MSDRILYIAENGKAIPKTVSKRELRPTEVRVEIRSIGINPIDWKTIDNNLADGAGQGNDFSGTVVEIGSEVKSTKVGDTVAGGVGGGDVDNKEQGSFTNLLSVEEHLLFKFPTKLTKADCDSVANGIPRTFEQAASLGIAADTTVIAFEGHDKPSQGDWCLIYGVTSSLGYFAAQFAKNLGYSVIGVSSPNSIISELGIEWIDRNDSSWPQKAKEISSNNIRFLFDTICLDNSLNLVAQAASANSILAFADPGSSPDEKVLPEGAKVIHPLYFLLMQKVKKFGTATLPNPTKIYERAPQLVAEINKQLSENKIRSLPIRVLYGLDKVNEGLDMNRKGVKATKVVISLNE